MSCHLLHIGLFSCHWMHIITSRSLSSGTAFVRSCVVKLTELWHGTYLLGSLGLLLIDLLLRTTLFYFYVIGHSDILLDSTTYEPFNQFFGLIKLQNWDPLMWISKNKRPSSKVVLVLVIIPFLSFIVIVCFSDSLYTWDGWERNAHWGARSLFTCGAQFGG